MDSATQTDEVVVPGLTAKLGQGQRRVLAAHPSDASTVASSAELCFAERDECAVPVSPPSCRRDRCDLCVAAADMLPGDMSPALSCDDYAGDEVHVHDLCSLVERLLPDHGGKLPLSVFVTEATDLGFDGDGDALKDVIFSPDFRDRFLLKKKGFFVKR